jgi:hypothetical protein
VTTQTDPRVQELLDLARAENIRLPYPIDMIIFLEKRGRIVDLVTGAVYNAIVATPTPQARAVCHLLSEVTGKVTL